MPFFSVADLLIASGAPSPRDLLLQESQAPIEKIVTPKQENKNMIPIEDNENVLKESFVDVPKLEIKPFVIEGSVENFDPVSRASQFSKIIPKNWCGSYRSFTKESEIDVIVNFSQLIPNGQMVQLKGEMTIGKMKTPISGYFNAKSDQLEIIPLGDKLIAGLEPGGSFLGFNSINLLGWNPPRLENPGGKLLLTSKCDEKVSETPPFISVW